MRAIFTLVIILSLITLGYSDPKKPKRPTACSTKACSDWDWKNQRGTFDPHSIQWPLHYNGETYLDRVDGGDHDIDVVFSHHYKKTRMKLKNYRNSAYHPSPWFLDEGLPMHDPFVCEVWDAEEPKWESNYCAMVGSTYEDVQVFVDGPSCSKIVRKWAVIDWCKWEPNSVTNTRPERYTLVKDVLTHSVYWSYGGDNYDVEHDGWYTFDQVIKIIDEDAPEISDCSNIEIDLEGDCSAKIKLRNKAIDSGPCPGVKMEVEVVVYDSDGDHVTSKWVHAKHDEEFALSLGYLGPGDYSIHWSVTDGCRNKGGCIQKLTVIDKNPPHLICLQDLSTAINDESGVSIWAKDFVHKVEGPCYDDNLTYSFYRDTIVTSVSFDCPDGIGLNELEVFVTSSSGVQVSCNTSIFVADHSICDPEAMQIAGIVTDRFKNAIEGAEIMVTADNAYVSSDMSNEFGKYGVNGITFDLGRPVVSASFKSDERNKGLDGVDLIYLLRHVMGIESLPKTDQRAAADIDSDGDIDMEDYWDLVDLVYEIPGRDANPEPWKFFDDKLMFFGTTDATRLVEPVKIARFRHEYSLIGVKTGDLDFSWRPGEVASNRSAAKSSHYSSTIEAGKSEYVIDVPTYGKIMSVSLSANVISDDNLKVSTIDGSELAYIVESDEQGDRIIILSTDNLSGTKIVISSTQSFELTGQGALYEGEEADGILVSDWVLTSFESTASGAMMVSPNPFEDVFTLTLESIDNQNGTLEVFNMQGQRLLSKDLVLTKGVNQTVVDGATLQSGLYVVALSTSTGRISKRIVKR